ncbi:hypothetical protein VPHD148_0243 [Vibrio phage D148]
MENQHRQIKGYRELSQTEIDGMNKAKEIGAAMGALIEHLESQEDIDQRWLAIAKTDLQKGVMSLVRSIAKPTVF